MAKRVKRTKYQLFQKASSKYCETGSAKDKTLRDKREKEYLEDAKKKGKSAKEAREIASRVKKCPAKVGKTRKGKKRK